MRRVREREGFVRSEVADGTEVTSVASAVPLPSAKTPKDSRG